MLFIALKIGKGDYALAASSIVEVLPLVNLKPVPRAPKGIAGLFDYRGVPVPVIDLSLLATGVPCRDSMTTRIAVVNYAGSNGKLNRLGLVAEHLTNAFHEEATAFEPPGVAPLETPFLGPVIRRSDRIIQLIEVEKILPPQVSECLFNDIDLQARHDSSHN